VRQQTSDVLSVEAANVNRIVSLLAVMLGGDPRCLPEGKRWRASLRGGRLE
jgi:hypothetical protein